MDKKDIRCRYAPSPTGFLHIGGARTALFNFLFAKHNHGQFIVRIEDTDVARNVEGGIASQLNNLKWMGIIPDESILNPGKYGPYIQSKKLEKYQSLANQLLKENKAYYCFCNEKELEEQRQLALATHQTPKYNRKCLNLTESEIKNKLAQNIPHVIRLKMPDNRTYEWDDLIRGHLSVPSSALTDPVILKSNGIPMYNFAVVVDDHDMQISHVLRGEEHISNTPYQLAIAEALGYDDEIQYGHLSIITDETGKKLSKRNKDLKQFIEDYRNLGIPSNALNNFLALLGWTNKHGGEIAYDLNDLIKAFDINNVSKAPAFFDIKKLYWVSGQHIRHMDEKTYLEFVKPFLTINCENYTSIDKVDLLLLTFKNQISYAQEINDLIKSTFDQQNIQHLPKDLIDFIHLDSSKQVISRFKEKLLNIDTLNLENSTIIINEIKQTLPNIKGRELYLPLRIATIGLEHGPEMNKIMTIVGKTQILKNIKILEA